MSAEYSQHPSPELSCGRQTGMSMAWLTSTLAYPPDISSSSWQQLNSWLFLWNMDPFCLPVAACTIPSVQFLILLFPSSELSSNPLNCTLSIVQIFQSPISCHLLTTTVLGPVVTISWGSATTCCGGLPGPTGTSLPCFSSQQPVGSLETVRS